MPEYAGKTLLFVGGGKEALPGIQKAQQLGIYVVVSDMNPQAAGLLAADAGIIASTYDARATLQAAADYSHKVRQLDGVMCLATDVPLTVATIAQKLGLPGIPVGVAALAMDKLAMKEKFASDGVPIPWFSAVADGEALKRIVASRSLPLVLKPVDSRGGRGVQLLNAGMDLTEAFAISQRHSPTGRVMVEEFLAGPQVSTESIVLDGQAYTSGFSDRNYEFMTRYAPHFIENGGDLPSHLSADIQLAVKELVQHAATSLGVVSGVVKGDIVVNEGRPYVIELAARLSGGYFCTHEIPLNTGVDHVLAMIRLSLGLPVDPLSLEPRWQRAVCQRYLFPPPGRIVRVPELAAVHQMAGVEVATLHVQPGDCIIKPTDSNAAAGMVIAVGDDNAEARQRAAAAIAALQVETEPI